MLSAQGSALRSTPANLRSLEKTRLRGFSLSEIYVLEQNFSTSFSAFTNRGKLACKFSSMGAIDQRCSSLARFLFDSAHICDSFKIVFRTASEAPSLLTFPIQNLTKSEIQNFIYSKKFF
uniref:hypothetical protein n=1 Tax=Escherichia coli TaxID=562 RepID=UPI00155D8D75|nr:hypothetical protein [Escherichia coli]